MSFSDRILTHPLIAMRPDPPAATKPLVLAMNNQLLVSRFVSAAVQQDLRDNVGIEPRHIAWLQEGLGLPPVLNGEDVEILGVDLPVPGVPDIFKLVSRLRDGLAPSDHRKVTPNHILVPAAEDHSCPHGPPEPTAAGELPEGEPPLHNVVIIDSGYQWQADWGANPLEAYAGPILKREAHRLVDPVGWKPGRPDIPNVPGHPEILGALSGHANFIAGVIAQHTRHARIEVLNHNGGFDVGRDDLPTEAGVVRSLCRCRKEKARVINLGFAFTAFEDAASCAWDIAFAHLGLGTIGKGPVVVSPAGNQTSASPRYPAALAQGYPATTAPGYPNMIGVGSTEPPLGIGGSFTNHGPWVTCSANGHGIRSTFLGVNMEVEDAPSPSPTDAPASPAQFDFTSKWATWSGTSFATPKVVAEIVNVMVHEKLSPLNAAHWAMDNHASGKDTELGYIFPL